MLCSMVIKIISMCFRIFLSSFCHLFAEFGLVVMTLRKVIGSQRVTNMNSGHVKGVQDVNEVAIFSLMNFAFREIHFLSKLSQKKAMDCLYRCIQPLYTSLYYPWSYYGTMLVVCLHPECHINVNVFSVTFGFDPRPMSSRNRLEMGNPPEEEEG